MLKEPSWIVLPLQAPNTQQVVLTRRKWRGENRVVSFILEKKMAVSLVLWRPLKGAQIGKLQRLLFAILITSMPTLCES